MMQYFYIFPESQTCRHEAINKYFKRHKTLVKVQDMWQFSVMHGP